MAHLYDVGTKAWQPDPNEGWMASELEQKIINGDKVKLVFKLENGSVWLDRSVELLANSPTGENRGDHGGCDL
jgi:myosin-5